MLLKEKGYILLIYITIGSTGFAARSCHDQISYCTRQIVCNGQSNQRFKFYNFMTHEKLEKLVTFITNKIWLNLLVEIFVDEVEPLVGQNKFDVGQFRHSALIFDETISFTEQGSFHQSDRPVLWHVQSWLQPRKYFLFHFQRNLVNI